MKSQRLQKDLTFSISLPLISTGSMFGMVLHDTSPLHFLNSKSVLGFKGPLTFEQCLFTQKPQAGSYKQCF